MRQIIEKRNTCIIYMHNTHKRKKQKRRETETQKNRNAEKQKRRKAISEEMHDKKKKKNSSCLVGRDGSTIQSTDTSSISDSEHNAQAHTMHKRTNRQKQIKFKEETEIQETN